MERLFSVKLRLACLLARRLIAGRRVRTKFKGMKILVSRGVFNPKWGFSTAALIELLSRRKNEIYRKRIADAGTGCGAVLVALGVMRASNWLVGCDIDISSLKDAVENSKANLVYGYVDLVACDWLSAFRRESFDVVVSNPPYLPLEPSDEREKTIFAGVGARELLRLVESAYTALRRHGFLFFTVSSLTPFERIRERLVDLGFTYARTPVTRTFFDKIFVVEAQLIVKDSTKR